MKYFIFTITFLLVILLLYTGILFYVSYKKWSSNKDKIISKLYELRKNIEYNSGGEISITPDLNIREANIIFDRYGEIVAKFSEGRRKIIGLKEISPVMIKLLLSMEDRRFYQHRGIDYRAILSALYYDLKSLSFVRGGSTITQQLAKILFTNRKKNLKRKVYELFCALEIEKHFTKDEILTLYLNSIYFGHYMYGIYDASMFYFNKKPLMLDIYESSLLVAIIPNPTRFSPLIHPERAKRRMKLVLSVARSMGYIKNIDLETRVDEFWKNFKNIRHFPVITRGNTKENRAPYFVDYVKYILKNRYDLDLNKIEGLRIYTTLDLKMQKEALESLREGLEIHASKLKKLSSDLKEHPEGALVSVNPNTGEIYALIGGKGFSYSNQFNRAVFAKRQVGSAFKPFVFAAAIEYKGYTPETKIVDRPIKIKTPTGIWRPKNYNNRYYGEVTLATALQKSLNSVAVQLLRVVGPEKVIQIVSKALELTENETNRRFKPYLSLALGAFTFTPLELAKAYSIFPNRGEIAFIHGISKIVDSGGRIIVDNSEELSKQEFEYDIENKLNVITPETALTLCKMMEKVLEKGGTAYWAVKGAGLDVRGWGKTGTTNKYTDAWFVGFADGILSVVWVGFDDPKYSLGKGQSGGTVAAPIWAEFMKNVLWRR